MKKYILLPCALLTSVILSGCSASAFEPTLQGNVDDIPAPIITAASVNQNTMDLSVTWTYEAISGTTQFKLYATQGSNQQSLLVTDNIYTSNSPNTVVFSNRLTEGFGSYTLQMTAIVNLKQSPGSNAYSINYNGHFNYSSTIGSSQLSYPSDIVKTPNGDIYVSDTGNHRIMRYGSTGSFIEAFGSQGNQNWQFNAPRGLSTNAAGDIFVADSQNDRVVQFSPSTWNSSGWQSYTNSFNTPTDVYVDGNNFYVSDLNNNRVVRHNGSSFDITQGSSGTGTTNYRGPSGITKFNGNIVVADRNNNRLKTQNTSLVFINHIINNGSGLSGLGSIIDLSVDSTNTILFASDSSKHHIKMIDDQGSVVGYFGTEGSDNGEFKSPSGVYYDGSKLYVADSGNNRIQVFTRVSQ